MSVDVNMPFCAAGACHPLLKYTSASTSVYQYDRGPRGLANGDLRE